MRLLEEVIINITLIKANDIAIQNVNLLNELFKNPLFFNDVIICPDTQYKYYNWWSNYDKNPIWKIIKTIMINNSFGGPNNG